MHDPMTGRWRGGRASLWTVPLESSLVSDWAAGYSGAAIAERLGIAVQTVLDKAARLGLRDRRPSDWTPSDDQHLRELHATGDSFSQMAVEMSKVMGREITRNACIGRAQRIGLVRDKRPVSTKPASKARQARREKRHAKVPAAAPILRSVFPIAPTPPRFIPGGPKPLRIGLVAVREGQCRDVCDDKGEDGLALFCGHPTVAASWCAWHASVNFQHPGRAV